MPIRIRDKGDEGTTYQLTTLFEFYSSDGSGVYPELPGYSYESVREIKASTDRQHFEDYVCDPELKCSKVNRYKPVLNHRIKYDNFGPVDCSGEALRFDTPETPLARINLTSWWALPWGEGVVRDMMDAAIASNSEVFNPFYSNDEFDSALNQLISQIQFNINDTNVYAILLEAVDLRNLIPGLLGNLSKTISQEAVAGDLSDKWLSWNWGFVPLMNDIDNINALLLRIEYLFNKWNDFARKGKVLSFHTTVCKQRVGGTHAEVTNSSSSFVNRYDDSTQYLAEYTSKLSLYIKPELMNQDAIIRFRNSKLGLYKPISGIYEATRLSWLVDYFSNIGDFLNGFEDSLSGAIMKYNVVDFGISEKTTKWANVKRYANYHHGNLLTNNETLSDTLYTRTPLDPAAFKAIGTDNIEFDYSLSPVQLTNLGAVLA